MAQGVSSPQTVHGLLMALRGLDPLKRLFWTELNYSRVNQPLSRRGWPDSASQALAECLFANKNVDAISAYERKLEIIQRNLYGVNIDPFAVNIARLRLWLSLAIEFEGDNPPPLPNLDYKVEAGDSLSAPNPSGDLEQGFRKALIDELLSKKAEYLMAHGGRKVRLRKEIGELRETITGWAHGGGSSMASTGR